MSYFPAVDTTSPSATEAAVLAIRASTFGSAVSPLLQQIFAEIGNMFAGRYMDYQAIDVRYHNLEHTLQATLCFSRIMEGWSRSQPTPPISGRDFDLGVTAMLMHDSGYLRQRSDNVGSGAKYTLVHVLRSCAFAATHLPLTGATLADVDAVTGWISCTGARSTIKDKVFGNEHHRVMGQAVAAADYLSQLADPGYPQKLEALYAEFLESDEYFNVPREHRLFKSAEDLISRTPGFWIHFVLPKMEGDCAGVYHYLENPAAPGPSEYVRAIEQNMVKISALTPASADA